MTKEFHVEEEQRDPQTWMPLRRDLRVGPHLRLLAVVTTRTHVRRTAAMLERGESSSRAKERVWLGVRDDFRNWLIHAA